MVRDLYDLFRGQLLFFQYTISGNTLNPLSPTPGERKTVLCFMTVADKPLALIRAKGQGVMCVCLKEDSWDPGRREVGANVVISYPTPM